MQGAMDSISFDIFLSYNSRDKAAVERIVFLQQQDGFVPWLDAWNLLAGGDWQIKEMKVANRNLIPMEWQRFINDPADLNRPYLAACDNLPRPGDAARGTPVASGEAA